MWKPEVANLIFGLLMEIKKVLKNHFKGFYIHGSLAMGGFNPGKSDVDILVVTLQPLLFDTKKELAALFLARSNDLYPLEASILNESQLNRWQHPCPFDFHFSEYWRERYEEDLENHINSEKRFDPDLAAHITILKHRGICLDGAPIQEAFPAVPEADYIDSILGDYYDCIKNIENDPVYCALNMIRVYWYLKEGVISSKQEAGEWANRSFPEELLGVAEVVMRGYSTSSDVKWNIHKSELFALRDYIFGEVQGILK